SSICFSRGKNSFYLLYFFCAVLWLCGKQLQQLLLLCNIGSLKCLYIKIRFFVFYNITPHLLSKSKWIAKGIEIIILKLEGYAQVKPKVINKVAVFLTCPCHYGAHFHSRPHQHCRFVFNHFKILLNGNIITLLKIYIPLLPLAHL